MKWIAMRILVLFYLTGLPVFTSVYAASKSESEAALNRAALWCEIKAVESLIAEGVDADALLDGETPLLRAVDSLMAVVDKEKKSAGDCTGVVKLLISAGANVNAVDKNGSSVLARAVQSQKTEIVKLLIEAKANVNLKDQTGFAPLMAAVGDHQNIEIVKLLIEAKANVHATSQNGCTALFLVQNNVEAARILLAAKAKVNIKCDFDGRTPLMSVGPDVVRLLIKAKANINTRDKSGRTALKRFLGGNQMENPDGFRESIEILRAAGAK